MIYFTADQHFDHEGILDSTGRPFSRVSLMNKAIIKNYNDIVNDNDEVYFVGDVSLLKHKNLIAKHVQQLKGVKHLILGNHDCLKVFEYEEVGFMTVHTGLRVEEFFLYHDPSVSAIYRNEQQYICGHVHDLFKHIKNVVNVGVDVWDFKPVSIDEVRQLFIDLKMLSLEKLFE